MSLVKADMANHRQHQPSLATNASIVPASAIPESSNPTLQQQQQQQQAAVELIIVDGERCRNSRHELESAAAHNVNVLLSSRQGTKYAADRIIGNGSFGVVYMATIPATGETVAIKKVLQDPKFKNRELQIMSLMAHPNAVRLRHCFYSRGDAGDSNELYLNLVMDYVPDTLHKALRVYQKANKLMPLSMMKAYTYQLVRSLNYIHSMGVAHRDIKPQNLLLDSKRHHLLLCDCGSAKQLIRGEPNVAYICSRYYRAPELVFEATQYNCSIDMWSAGCVLGEMLMGAPLFPGESAVDQLIEIIKVLGTPSKEEIHSMNPNHTTFKFPQIKPHPWTKVFKGKAPAAAIDLIQRWLCYEPEKRLHPLDSMGHEFFDELREEGFMGGVCEHLFDFSEAEVRQMRDRRVAHKVVPRWLWRKYDITGQ